MARAHPSVDAQRDLLAELAPAPPPILEDLYAPIHVGACPPGQETYSGAHVIAAWRGRLVLGWPLSRKARNRRRAIDDLHA